MKYSKTASVAELQGINRLESLRKLLLSDEYKDHLEKPLGDWALPTDRRLPLAFLGRTLKDLLNTSFTELSSTPGIGEKKMCSFVRLLARAVNTDPTDLPSDLTNLTREAAEVETAGTPSNGHGFNPAAVSEVVWARWQASVVKHGLGKEKLGRFAPTLRNMTRVIWNTPLEEYTNLTLGDVRAMKTHGEKRVCAILEVFHGVHALVADMGIQPHLAVHIVPCLIDGVEQWIGNALQTSGIPSREEIFEHFISPLLEQVRTDATQLIARLAESRSGVAGLIISVRQLARDMGLTRARVYQLLNEINDIMAVRWPMGRHQVYELRRKFQAEVQQMDAPPDLHQFYAAVELFYPGSRRGAAGPLEHVGDVAEDEEEAAAEAQEEEHFVGSQSSAGFCRGSPSRAASASIGAGVDRALLVGLQPGLLDARGRATATGPHAGNKGPAA